MEFLGTSWVSVNPENGQKLLLSFVFTLAVLLVSSVIKALFGKVTGGGRNSGAQIKFWTRQGVSLASAVVLILGLLSIWFSEPARLAMAFGLWSAGLAFALQHVITALAGYFVILRASTFTVGDRIPMGGVRGDVMRRGFIQTTIMEMGQPPGAQVDQVPAKERARIKTDFGISSKDRNPMCISGSPTTGLRSRFVSLWKSAAAVALRTP